MCFCVRACGRVKRSQKNVLHSIGSEVICLGGFISVRFIILFKLSTLFLSRASFCFVHVHFIHTHVCVCVSSIHRIPCSRSLVCSFGYALSFHLVSFRFIPIQFPFIMIVDIYLSIWLLNRISSQQLKTPFPSCKMCSVAQWQWREGGTHT